MSRSDLIKSLAAAPAAGGTVSDAQLARDMLARRADEPWVTNPVISVKAENGVIWLWGQVAAGMGSDRDDGLTNTRRPRRGESAPPWLPVAVRRAGRKLSRVDR